jgi:hypothetical protein
VIGLTLTCVRLMIRASLACLDLMFLLATLGKVDPRTRHVL